MKKSLAIIAIIALSLILSPATPSFGAGYGEQSSTETKIAIIGENVEMTVRPPLDVAIGITTIAWQMDRVNPIYAGQVIAEGEATITNVSPIPQVIYFDAYPIYVEGIWPGLEVITFSNGKRIYNPVLEPKKTITLKIKVRVAYYSSISGPFKGVELRVSARSPDQNKELG